MKFSSFLSLLLFLVGPASATTRKLHVQTTDLKNGAELALNITSPSTNSTFSLGRSDGSIDLPIQGTASVGLGHPDVAYIYIIDTSSSTEENDGDCGTVLECVQAFFIALHKEAISDGSAELAGVINFDDATYVDADLQDPRNGATAIEVALRKGVSSGGTDCSTALLEAAKLVEDPSNTAGTTVVVFAGDGLCNDDPTSAADILGATGAIVHSIAVGDSVECDISQSQSESNHLADIPRNGGTCTSVPDPDTLPAIIDDLIGSDLLSLELQVDGGNYTDISSDNLSVALPQEGAISVDFDTLVVGLPTGNHEICVRVTGNDTLGGWDQVEDCHQVFVGQDKLAGWGIFLSVASVLVFVGGFGYCAVTKCYGANAKGSSGKSTSGIDDQVTSDKGEPRPPLACTAVEVV